MESVLAFVLGSLLSATASNIDALIIFRIMYGLSGGILMLLGTVLGGWLIDTNGWQWIFWINLPIGLIAFCLAALLFPRDHATPSELFDVLGMLLSTGFMMFLYGVSSIPSRGTAVGPHMWLPLDIGLVVITGFVTKVLYRADHPLIDLRLFKNRVVMLANLPIAFLFAAAFFAPCRSS
ncbi:MFS transporter [Mycobacterium uberis]|uniref:MFS transporter n=1 Tax=Mycobacterium uberis TaxID=2162698 RepID=UPI0010588323|nr:MFS transporter [Mycobacterium uberis]